MATPNYKLKNDHVMTAGHGRQLYTTLDTAKADKATTYTKTQVDTALSSKTDTTNVYTKSQIDTSLSQKKTAGTFDTKIENGGSMSRLDCSGNNQIDIRANGTNLGYFYQPVGQATTPLGLYTPDKLQLSSQLSATSVYGAKPLSTDGSLNTHGLYVTGLNDNAKNVQSVVNITQGNAQVYLSAGHVNPGSGMADFAVLAANKTLQISGGLLPGVTDKQIIIHANSQAQAIPIQMDGKAGYTPAASVTVTEPTQFTSKSYVDAADALKLNLSGGTLTGALTLAANPTTNLQAATKQYVDSVAGGSGTGDFKKDGSVAMTGNLNVGTNRIVSLGDAVAATDALNVQTGDGRYYKQTVKLNGIAAPDASVSMNGQRLTSVGAASDNSDAVNLGAANLTYLRVDAQNAPQTFSIPNTFIQTKTPTQPSHVATKAYVDNFKPPAIQNGLNNSIEIDSSGVVTMNAAGHTVHTQITAETEQVVEQVQKKRKMFLSSILYEPLALFMKNMTNDTGLLLSSGYYNGSSTTDTSFPFIGIRNNFTGQDTPFLQYSTLIGAPRFLGRVFKSTIDNISTLGNNDLLNKKEVLDMIEANTRNSWVFRIKLGEVPPGSTITNFESRPANKITGITYQNISAVARVIIVHDDPGWDFRVTCTMFADRASTNDNDAGAQNFWVYQVSRTQTQILFEYGSEAFTQDIGYNVVLHQF